MRVDIALDPKATHYCKWCGLTMKAKDEIECQVCDGDFCQAVKRVKKPAENESNGTAMPDKGEAT